MKCRFSILTTLWMEMEIIDLWESMNNFQNSPCVGQLQVTGCEELISIQKQVGICHIISPTLWLLWILYIWNKKHQSVCWLWGSLLTLDHSRQTLSIHWWIVIVLWRDRLSIKVIFHVLNIFLAAYYGWNLLNQYCFLHELCLWCFWAKLKSLCRTFDT